ncbi:MAG TPA: glycine--tRNA ligase subunit beta [Allosphingosinicella sp.]|jgi:glycyl-tRNA synthetase beta chain
MTDFLLELLSEEIPARMQAKASADLARLFTEQLAAAGLAAQGVETFATPRRLALIARGLPTETAATREETKGPRTSAPPQALEGFLRKTGLSQDQLVDRDGIWFAVVDKPGRATRDVLAEAIPAIVRTFPWPKSMRWGAPSASTESPRWVRPLQGIVALLGEEIVDFEIAGVRSGAATVGHRFHHPGIITIGSADDYAEKLRACHVIVDPAERMAIIRDASASAAEARGLRLVEDEGLVAENAGLTEWPVPLLGSFDPAFLDVPPEVIQLTMRTNQKYFALVDGAGALAPNFLCTANIDPSDNGAAIIAGNEKVLAARLSDAKFFWEGDLKIPLEEQAKKLSQIVFHEKLGTVADKVERVAKLARWLVEEGVVKSSPERGGGPAKPVEGALHERSPAQPPLHQPAAGPPPRAGEDKEQLAALAERAARLCKADLVTGMVGEFPELQGLIGGYLARAQGEDAQVANAIRDHYKPVGQGDEVPSAPITVAVSLADKLDTLVSFFAVDERPTGSKDPYALRRAALGAIQILLEHGVRVSLDRMTKTAHMNLTAQLLLASDAATSFLSSSDDPEALRQVGFQRTMTGKKSLQIPTSDGSIEVELEGSRAAQVDAMLEVMSSTGKIADGVTSFFADRLKVQQREAGVRHDLIDAVFALGGEDDLVRLLARVRALQSFVETPEGRDLLAGYKRAANILKKEGRGTTPSPSREEVRLAEGERGEGTGASRAMSSPEEQGIPQTGEEDPLVLVDDPQLADAVAAFNERHPQKQLSYTPEPEESALVAALDSAEPRARAAVEAEDFEGAMAALALLRGPVDAFFDKVTVNDPDPAKRETRLDLLARMRDAVHSVADFSRIEG